MMKLYADLFELTADSISRKSIRRLRWLTIGSLPYLPMIAFLILYGMPRSLAVLPLILAFLLFSCLTVTVLLSRIVNRVWALDKYLDEWEKDIKRISMTRAYMAMMYVALTVSLIWHLFFDVFEPFISENLKAIPFLILIVLIGTGFYTQIFTQLAHIKPMDEDELDQPKYIKTSVRGILGIIAASTVGLFMVIVSAGFYAGHRAHNIEYSAAQEACGEADVDTHERAGIAVEVTCDGSDIILRLDAETLELIEAAE